ncbi:MAG: hypothetical protein ABFC84_02535 [Veillonellales bacterium]
MSYNSKLPADDEYIATGPADIRENFRALKEDQIVNAGTLSGLSVGNASGNIPESNGTVNANLNADRLDGYDASAFAAANHAHSAVTTSTPGFMSAVDKAKLEGIAAGAQVNQNAFSNVLAGSTTIQADSQTDTLEIVGGANISVVADATNDRLIFAVNGKVASAGYADSAGYAASAGSAPANGGTSTTVTGSYTGNGGQQAPNYFGTNKAGFLMMNTSINGDSNYKNFLIMDNYSGADVGGATALGLGRQTNRAFIMRSDANRTAWNESAELITTANIGCQSVNYAVTAGRAYPYRSDGGQLNFYWSGQGGQPSWLWGGNDGVNMYVYSPSNFSVNYAIHADYSGSGKTLATIDQIPAAHGKQLFTASGTFTVPAGVTQVWISLCGAGGNGGSHSNGSNGFCGGGGGGAAANMAYNVTGLTPGAEIAVTIGAVPGGATSFGSYISCAGGGTGGNGSYAFPGTGGVAGGAGGVPGESGMYNVDGSTQTPINTNTPPGGGCLFGVGGIESNGAGYGAGGAGGKSTHDAGYSGAPGMCLVEW